MKNVEVIKEVVSKSSAPVSAKDIVAATGLKEAQVLMSLSYLESKDKVKREKAEGVYRYALANT